MKQERTYYKINTSSELPLIIKECDLPHISYKVTYYPNLGPKPLSGLVLTELDMVPFSIQLSIQAKTDFNSKRQNNKHYAGTYQHTFTFKGVVNIDNGELDFYVGSINYDPYKIKDFIFTNLSDQTADDEILDYLQNSLKNIITTKDLIDFLNKHTSFEMIEE